MAPMASTAERVRHSRLESAGDGAGARPGAGPDDGTDEVTAARAATPPALRTDAAAPNTNSRREMLCAAESDSDVSASLKGSKFLRELHPDGARPGDAGVYRLLSAKQGIALRVAIVL